MIHGPIVLSKALFEIAWTEFGPAIENMMAHKFRAGADVLLPMVVIPNLALRHGQATVIPAPPEIFRYVTVAEWAASRLPYQFASVLGNLPTLLCLNNASTSENHDDDFLKAFDDFLEQLKK